MRKTPVKEDSPMTPPSHRLHYLTEHPRFLRWLQEVTLSDDIVMEVCLHNNTKCATAIHRCRC